MFICQDYSGGVDVGSGDSSEVVDVESLEGLWA
jgi:hypothetical protein